MRNGGRRAIVLVLHCDDIGRGARASSGRCERHSLRVRIVRRTQNVKTLETRRLYCREWEDADAADCAHLYAKPDVMQFIPGGVWTPERTARAIQRFKERTAQSGLPIYPILSKTTDTIIGHAGLGRVEDTEKTEVFYLLDDAYWGQGYAREAADAFLDVAFSRLALERVFALAFPANVRSHAVMRKLGMQPDGRAFHFGVELVQYVITASQR
jgi:RimJ/RimL family protein N-acetyltransferase